jgi:putative restriction endonuclease
MKKGQRLWTRDELIIAINLYCKLPFGRLHESNPDVIDLAKLIDRSPGSIAYKLVNFASLDPSLKARGIKGATNTSKLDREIWTEFYQNWDTLPFESEKLIAKLRGTTIENLNSIPDVDLPKEGKERERLIKTRVNQSFFRKMVLTAYNNTCCITGINQPELLIAGHIRPWGMDEKNRLNPRNGITLNALHDKSFELGHITITPDFVIKVAPSILKQNTKALKDYFHRYHSQKINLPSRFLPDIEFLKYHNETRFKH